MWAKEKGKENPFKPVECSREQIEEHLKCGVGPSTRRTAGRDSGKGDRASVKDAKKRAQVDAGVSASPAKKTKKKK